MSEYRADGKWYRSYKEGVESEWKDEYFLRHLIKELEIEDKIFGRYK